MMLHPVSVILDLRLAIQELDETMGLIKIGEKAADVLKYLVVCLLTFEMS